MTISQIILCALPGHLWQSAEPFPGLNVVQFVNDALGCERRIAKEVNLQDEFSRYTLVCRRLEQEVIASGRLRPLADINEFPEVLQAGLFPTMLLPPGYVTLLSGLLDEANNERIGASFFPPDQVAQQRQAFAAWAQQRGVEATLVVQQRLLFLDRAERLGCGIVELQSTFLSERTSRDLVASYRPAGRGHDEEKGQFVIVPAFVVTELDTDFFGTRGKKQQLFRTLVHQIEDAMRNGEPVAFGNQAPHDVITEALNHFVFVPEGEPLHPVKLRIAYADGSEAQPFPLFCLHRQSKTVPIPAIAPLRVALMSMRHFELDPEIDFCWFRNRAVSQTRTLAETDQFCFQTSKEQLHASLEMGDMYLHLFHTGFEPAVIGFYRSVVITLVDLQRETNKTNKLLVAPYFYRGGSDYDIGSIWR